MTEKLKSEEEEANETLKDKREEESEVDDHSSDFKWDSSEEESEYEHVDSLDKLLDGQLCVNCLKNCTSKSNV